MYWLDPQHCVVQGLATTQFHADHIPLHLGWKLEFQYAGCHGTDWKYASRGFNILALCLFVVVLGVVRICVCIVSVRET